MTPPSIYLPVLEWFRSRMEHKLAKQANVRKGHWDEMPQQALFERVKEEMMLELGPALVIDPYSEDVIDECADVANFCMMIADNARKKR